jgi:hypothetical protein
VADRSAAHPDEGDGLGMTIEEARRKARRLTAITSQPAVIFRCPVAGWDVWHTLDAAKWLAEDGEVVMPDEVRDPDELEQRLRGEAAALRGHARATLLEAVMTVRAQRVLARRAAG